MEHSSEYIQEKIQALLDQLCQDERSTGIESILIIRDKRGFCLRAVSGVQKFAPDDLTDQELLDYFGRP